MCVCVCVCVCVYLYIRHWDKEMDLFSFLLKKLIFSLEFLELLTSVSL